MTEDELDAIEARAEKATPGPWPNLVGGDGDLWLDGARIATPADELFISCSRTDVPALVAEVRKLRDRISMLEVAIKQYGHDSECRAPRGDCDCVQGDELAKALSQ